MPFPRRGWRGPADSYWTARRGKDWSYFTDKWHPMVSEDFAATYANKATDGVYYNGGNWMRMKSAGTSQESSMDGNNPRTRLQIGSGLKPTQTKIFPPARNTCRPIRDTLSLDITASSHGIRSFFKPWRWRDYVLPRWTLTTLNNQEDKRT